MMYIHALPIETDAKILRVQHTAFTYIFAACASILDAYRHDRPL